MELKFRRNRDYQDLRDEVVSERAMLNRRRLLAAAGALGTTSIVGALPACSEPQFGKPPVLKETPKFPASAIGHPKPGAALKSVKSAYTVADKTASERAVSGFNNYYEFGTEKEDPVVNAQRMNVSPWSVTVEGEAEKTGVFALTDVVDYANLEERILRHRCVERWSMVIPWIGQPMATVLGKFKPKQTAKFVQFESYLNTKEMPWTLNRVLDWPYVEGLRMDEAMNDLAFMAVGVHGKAMPKQSGAPLRTVLPWKYGFKATKAIVKIRFLEKQPNTTWNDANGPAYGFFANVNPAVDRPNDQSQERVLVDESVPVSIRKTELFNGYGSKVASLYAGMDLNRFY
jgi:methionine sulfoxide reductase catalytic subunit